MVAPLIRKKFAENQVARSEENLATVSYLKVLLFQEKRVPASADLLHVWAKNSNLLSLKSL